MTTVILIALALCAASFAVSAALLFGSIWLTRRDENARRAAGEGRDQRDQERLARYDEHLAQMNGRPSTSAITMRATRRDKP